MSESFAELFEESLAKTQMRPGAIITGTIVKVDNDFVTVNAGLKSEGVIPISQFTDDSGEIRSGGPVPNLTHRIRQGLTCGLYPPTVL